MYKMRDEYGCLWQEHWSNGGTGITKTNGPETAQITACVVAFGDPEIFMKGSELHSTKRNLNYFWEEYRKHFQGMPIRKG